MLKQLRSLLSPRPSQPPPAVPPGERVYAVGDIHGCSTLFAALIEAIEADDEARAQAQTSVILLGDLVDRGPQSAEVIAMARDLGKRRKLRILMGNHEEMLLDALENEEIFKHFLRFGGRETILSYPVDPDRYHRAELAEAHALMREVIPEADIEFIRGFEDRIEIGDFLFVHAGIRPGIPLDQQKTADLRWIRDPFLTHRESFGPVVVHGHTIFDTPRIDPNRISIDTGAYRSGRLSALALEASDRWLITAEMNESGACRAVQRSL